MATHSKSESSTSLTGWITGGIIMVAFLGGFILWPFITRLFTQEASSSLTKTLQQQAEAFAQSTVKTEFLPQTFTFVLQEKGTQERGDIYIANWNKDGKYISLLVGLTSNNKAINYQRVWTSPPADQVDQKRAMEYVKTLFTEPFLTSLGSLPCTEVTEQGKTLTQCGSMHTDATENLLGVTIRTPVTLTPPPGVTPPAGMPAPEATIISACFVPKEGTSAYTSSVCI
jgi:hypothetical protein